MRRCFYPSYLFIKWYLNVPKVQQDFVYEKNKDIKHNIFKGVRDVDCLFVGGEWSHDCRSSATSLFITVQLHKAAEVYWELVSALVRRKLTIGSNQTVMFRETTLRQTWNVTVFVSRQCLVETQFRCLRSPQQPSHNLRKLSRIKKQGVSRFSKC